MKTITKINTFVLALLISADQALAQSRRVQDKSLEEVAENVTESMGTILDVIMAGAFFAGLYFVVSGLVRVKRSYDSNGSTGASKGWKDVAIGVALMAVGSVLGIGIDSIFGSSTPTGEDYFN